MIHGPWGWQTRALLAARVAAVACSASGKQPPLTPLPPAPHHATQALVARLRALTGQPPASPPTTGLELREELRAALCRLATPEQGAPPVRGVRRLAVGGVGEAPRAPGQAPSHAELRAALAALPRLALVKAIYHMLQALLSPQPQPRGVVVNVVVCGDQASWLADQLLCGGANRACRAKGYLATVEVVVVRPRGEGCRAQGGSAVAMAGCERSRRRPAWACREGRPLSFVLSLELSLELS